MTKNELIKPLFGYENDYLISTHGYLINRATGAKIHCKGKKGKREVIINKRLHDFNQLLRFSFPHLNFADEIEIKSKKPISTAKYYKRKTVDTAVYCPELNMTFKSYLEASRYAGSTSYLVKLCCMGKRNSAGINQKTGERYTWKFANVVK